MVLYEKYGDWKHNVHIVCDFPLNPKGLEIHQLPECDKHQGYILYRFTDQQCDWIRFYSERDEAAAQFTLKKEAQRKKEIPHDHEYLVYMDKTRDRVMSTLYKINPEIEYARQGDRWVMEKVNIV